MRVLGQRPGLPPATAYRPLAIRLANRLFPLLWALGLTPPDLDESRLDGQARKVTGLSDFGDDRFREPMRVLIEALRTEARLNPLGRIIAHGSLLKILTDRLRAEDLLARHPEILERRLAPPIIVVGPMRSGTTRLQRLLACDNRFVHTRLFEMMAPVPYPSSFTAPRDPRITYTERGLRFLNWVNPDIAAVHPTGPMEADEELGLLELSCWGAQIEAQRRVPSFARWCETHDGGFAYDYLARLLKLIGWFRGDDEAKPWILKTPQYMQDLDALLRVFPGARLIFIHRDPIKVVGSACSLAWNQMVVQSDDVDPNWIGEEWLHKTDHRIRKTLDARETIADDRQLDLLYADMNQDWRAAMRRVYAFLGLDLTADVMAAMQAYIDRSSHEHGFARHRYRINDFGLDADMVDERFRAYRERFAIPREASRPD